MKKIIALALVAVMVMSFVACTPVENSGTNGTETTPVTGDPTSDPTEDPTEEPTEEGYGSLVSNIITIIKNKLSENAEVTPEDITNELLNNPNLFPFAAASMSFENGSFLQGFNLETVEGFESCSMFGPMIGAIPFVGYVFELADGADVGAFEDYLEEHANLRWLICATAERVYVEHVGNIVIFIMA